MDDVQISNCQSGARKARNASFFFTHLIENCGGLWFLQKKIHLAIVQHNTDSANKPLENIQFFPQSIAEQHHETNNQSNIRLQFTSHFVVSEHDPG